MKKLAFLVSSAATTGGIQKSLSMITKGLPKEKFTITVISLFNFGHTNYDYGSDVEFLKGSLTSNVDLKKNFVKSFVELKKLLESIEFDTLVVEGLGLVPFVSKKYYDSNLKKFIVVDHTGRNNFKKYGLSWWGLLITKKYADFFVVLTNENKKEYKKKFKNPEKIQVIPNSLDSKVITSPYNMNSRKICFVGRLSYEKGPDILIDAFSKTLSLINGKDWTLDIFGIGPEMPKLKEQIQNKELSNRIFLKGYENDIINRYKDYAFMVVPSRFESFGINILEALKVGIPVIAFDCNYGPRNLIRNNENGFLINENNTEELSLAINKLIEDNDLRLMFSKRTNLDLALYDFKNIILEWEKIL